MQRMVVMQRFGMISMMKLKLMRKVDVMLSRRMGRKFFSVVVIVRLSCWFWLVLRVIVYCIRIFWRKMQLSMMKVIEFKVIIQIDLMLLMLVRLGRVIWMVMLIIRNGMVMMLKKNVKLLMNRLKVLEMMLLMFSVFLFGVGLVFDMVFFCV